ncbi:hypothetical protein ACFL2D_02700 [Patescibacteria group bacterium]
MGKISHFFKKIGVLRTASYTHKGDAGELSRKEVEQGEMYQSPKEIDEEEARKQQEKQDSEQQ